MTLVSTLKLGGAAAALWVMAQTAGPVRADDTPNAPVLRELPSVTVPTLPPNLLSPDSPCGCQLARQGQEPPPVTIQRMVRPEVAATAADPPPDPPADAAPVGIGAPLGAGPAPSGFHPGLRLWGLAALGGLAALMIGIRRRRA